MMAANFGPGATDTSQELSVSSTPSSGVSSGPSIFDVGNALLGGVEEALSGLQEKRKTNALAGFTQQQLLVADALDQGRIRSSAHAQTLMRKNLLDAIEANPSLTKDLVSAQSSLMGLAGGARIVSTGDETEQRVKKRRDQLVTSGMLSATASDAEFASADQAHRIAVAAEERYQNEMKTLNAEKAKLELGSAQRKEVEAQEKEAAENLVKGSTEAEFFVVRTALNEIVAGNATEAEKQQAITSYMTEWKARTAAVFGDVPSSMREAIMPIFERLEQDSIARATGQLSDEELKRSSDRALSTAKALLLQNPEVAKLVTGSQLMKGDTLTGIVLNNPNQAGRKAFMEFFASTGDGSDEVQSVYSDDKTTTRGQRLALDTITNGLLSNDQATKSEAQDRLSVILQDMEDTAGKISRNPEKAIGIIDWIGSPQFLRAIKANPDAFDNVEGLKEVLQQHYHDEVSGLIKTQFSENKVVTFAAEDQAAMPGQDTQGSAATMIPSGSLVQAASNESGVNFVPIDPSNPDARKEAARLNKELKPIINQSVRASAHMAGRSDYQTVWEETSQAIFGEQGSAGDDKVAGGDAGDDLTIDSFKPTSDTIPLSNGDVDVSRVGNIQGSGFTHGRKMKSVDGMIIHHTGGRGNADTIAQVLQERGLSVQYVIDREGKIHQLMEDDSEAWHAGKNNDSGFSNKNTIGVEIIAKDDSDITPEQIVAAQSLVQAKANKFGFNPLENVFGHGEVASHKRKTEGQSVTSKIRGTS